MSVVTSEAETVKVAVTPLERDRLAHEARVLAAFGHRGLVRLIAYDADAGRLVTETVAGASLAATVDAAGGQASTLGAAEIGRVAAVVAATLADLHEWGCVHGAVTAEHILLAPAGPVLCSLSASGPTDRRDPNDDVKALGRVVLRVLAGGDDPATALRAALARSARTPRRRPSDPVADAIRAVAQRAISEPAPTARELAAEFARVEGAAGGPRLAIESGRRHRRSGRLARHAGLVGVVVAVCSAAIAWSYRHPTAAAPGEPLGPIAAAPTTTTAQPARLVWPTTSTSLAYTEGVLVLDGARFAVGDVGDLVAMGDWDCDGLATLVVYRPRSGEVIAFDTWPRADVTDAAVAGRVVGRVSGATAITAIERDGCAELALRTAAGTIERLAIT